jgi:hypothetical protein
LKTFPNLRENWVGLCVWREIAGKILSSAHRRTVYLSKLHALDKKVRVAFDWTLDLLFPKDVCVVYDFDRQGRDFDRRDHTTNMAGNNGDHEATAHQPVHSSIKNRLTSIDPVRTER